MTTLKQKAKASHEISPSPFPSLVYIYKAYNTTETLNGQGTMLRGHCQASWKLLLLLLTILCECMDVAGAQGSAGVGSSSYHTDPEVNSGHHRAHSPAEPSHQHSRFSFLPLDNFLMRKTERDFKPHLSNFCNSTDFSLVNNNARHTVYLSFPTVLSRCPFTTPQHSCLSDCQSMTLSAGTWLWERKAACP